MAGYSIKAMIHTGLEKIFSNCLSIKNDDKKGRGEGWFKLEFILDSSFSNMPLEFHLARWVAKDVYIDGSHLGSLGNRGINGKPYQEGT